MRLYGLLLTILALTALCLGNDQPAQDSLTAASSDQSQQQRASAPDILQSHDSRLDPYHRYVRRDEPRTVTCLKLRTYFLAREGRDSDTVEPAGYTTCQPASRYEMKFAVAPGSTAPR